MVQVLKSAWALLLGMLLLMVGNGLQGSLIGIRGDIEEFSTFALSFCRSLSRFSLILMSISSSLAASMYPVLLQSSEMLVRIAANDENKMQKN